MSINPPEPQVPKFWVLDANILFSTWACCLCFVMAQHAKALLCWTPLIEEECFRNLVRLKRLHPQDSDLQRRELSKALGARVLPPASEAYFGDVQFVHEKDRHVAASALALCHAEFSPVGVLTWNTRDFPRKALLKRKIVRYDLDELLFALHLSDTDLLALLNSSLDFMRSFQARFELQFPTDYALRARPLPACSNDWALFLSRCRMHKAAKRLMNLV